MQIRTNNTPSFLLYVNGRKNYHERLEETLVGRELGYQILALSDAVPDHVRRLVADFREVDTQDYQQCVDIARHWSRQHRVAGIVNWSETDVPLRNLLATELGLPGTPRAAVELARNKLQMRRALAHLDVGPRFAEVNSEADLFEAIATVGLPAILKPTGGSGSKGILEIHRQQDAMAAFRVLQGIATAQFDAVFRGSEHRYILEELLDGDEVSVEGFVRTGEITISGITDKTTTLPYHIEMRHVFPSAKPDATQHDIMSKAKQIVSALGLDNCAFHLEGRCTSRGFRLIECAARPGGGYITTHLLPLSIGRGHLRNCVRVATSLPLEPLVHPGMTSCVRFVLADQAGRFSGFGTPAAFAIPQEVQHIFVHAHHGDSIRLPPQDYAAHRVGAVIGMSTDREALIRRLDAFADGVRVNIDP